MCAKNTGADFYTATPKKRREKILSIAYVLFHRSMID